MSTSASRKEAGSNASSREQAPVRRRLPPAERRRQLLDVARRILEERGPSAVTMERIAVTAGVDKALPYRYFTNAHSVLVEIYQEYSFILAARVSTAVTEAATIEEKVDAAVGAYLDVIAEHRIMLGLLALSRTAVPTETEEALRANDFVVELFVGQFGVPRPIAAMTADVVVTLLEGTARAWARNPERRDFLQRLAVAAILATVSEAVQVS